MIRISELSEEQNNNLAIRSSKGHCYFFETTSLIYELKKLQNDNDAESRFWRQMLGEVHSKEVIQENYIFYVKNSIYRIYDLVNKYSKMIGEYYEINKLDSWNKFMNIESQQFSKIPKSIRIKIRKLRENKDLKDILISRHSMTHNMLVKTNDDYISHWVLPLDGEEALSFDKWKSNSELKLKDIIEKLSQLFLDTIEIILNEEI